MGRPEVTELVESADCLLMLGCFLTDINLGIFTAKLDPSRVHRRDERGPADPPSPLPRGPARRLHPRADRAPAERHAGRRSRSDPNPFARPRRRSPGDAGDLAALFGRLNRMLAESTEMTVIADIGDSLFGAADLEMHRHTEFLSPAYYTSMGFGVPAARRGEHGQPGVADPRHRGRRRLPDDRHGALDDRPARAQPDRRAPQQPRLHDRAVPARRAASTTSGIGRIHKIPEVLGGGIGIRGPHRRGARRRARGRAGQYRRLQPAERPPRSRTTAARRWSGWPTGSRRS